MLNLMGTVLVFTEERPVFLREQSNKMYGVVPYFLSKVVIELPPMILAPLLLLAIVYFGIGFENSAENFFSMYGALFCIVLSATSFGYFLSSIFEKAEIATQVSPVVMMPLILFGGLMANTSTIPEWISWI